MVARGRAQRWLERDPVPRRQRPPDGSDAEPVLRRLMGIAGEVLVVGSSNVDLVIRAAQLPAPGQSVSGGVFAQYQGGKGANQAVAAARNGAKVTMVGAVGADEYGQSALT